MNSLLACALVILLAFQSASLSVLHFNWPTGTVARVETDYLRESGGGQDAQRLRITHLMRVVPHTDGRMIESTNPVYVNSSGSLEQSLTALLSQWIPRTIVNDKGGFLRTEGTEHLQQIVTDMFEPQLRTSAARMLPAFKAYLELLTSGNALKLMAASDWDHLVGRWVGIRVMEEMLEGKGAVSISPGLNVPATIRTGLVERVPCTRGDEQLQCGIYEFKASVDRAGLALIMKSLLQGANRSDGPKIEWLDMQTVERVTLESDTMLPHDFTMTRTMHETGELNGVVINGTEVERLHSVFTYLIER